MDSSLHSFVIASVVRDRIAQADYARTVRELHRGHRSEPRSRARRLRLGGGPVEPALRPR